MKIILGNAYTFSAENKPVDTAKAGEVLLFKTNDCFEGQIKCERDLVTEIDFSRANPTAGPVYIEDAKIGDVLVVDILNVEVGERGFACSFPGMGPLHHLCENRTKVFDIKDGCATLNDISWTINPMVGVIGTAPKEGAFPCGLAQDHGGNMDCNKIVKGTRVYLPVRVDGALLQMGDLHASRGDGEISGTGIEINGEVLVRTSLIKNFELNWPAVETDDMYYVNSTGKDYEESLINGTTEMARLMSSVYGWDTTDIFVYLSVQGSIEINQAARPFPGDMLNLRVGIPKLPNRKLI